jgi:hypothetical protein
VITLARVCFTLPISGWFLTRLANELDDTSDFLLDGSMDDKTQGSISDKKLLSQFQRISKMDNKNKVIVKELLSI